MRVATLTTTAKSEVVPCIYISSPRRVVHSPAGRHQSKMHLLLLTFLAVSSCWSLPRAPTKQPVSVVVFFRHGDRTPVDPYPLDPWGDAKYWPVPFGELTDIGKRQHYELGTVLRERYKVSFLYLKLCCFSFNGCKQLELSVNRMWFSSAIIRHKAESFVELSSWCSQYWKCSLFSVLFDVSFERYLKLDLISWSVKFFDTLSFYNES